MKRSFVLSSTGLQNVITNDEEYFYFRIGKQEIKLHKFLAEYLSPTVSKLHRSDPTITHINYDDIFHNNAKENLPNIEQIITDDLIKKLYQLSKGHHIEINEEECFGMCVLSIILGNEEMFDLISKQFYDDSNKVDKYIDQLQYFCYFSHKSCHFNYTNSINILASQFYKIDKQKLLKLPKNVLYKIISDKKLKLESEDSLFDFIQDIFQNYDNENDEEIYCISDFYEQLDFMSLSNEKFREFMNVFDSNQITNSIWKKLSNYMLKINKSVYRFPSNNSQRYIKQSINQSTMYYQNSQPTQYSPMAQPPPRPNVPSQAHFYQQQQNILPIIPPQQQNIPPIIPPQQQNIPPIIPPQQQNIPPIIPPQQQNIPPIIPPQQQNIPPIIPPQQQNIPPIIPPQQQNIPPIIPPQQQPPIIPPQHQHNQQNLSQQQPIQPPTRFIPQQRQSNLIHQIRQNQRLDDDDDDEVARFLETKNMNEQQKQVFIRCHRQRTAIDLESLYFMFEASNFDGDIFQEMLNHI